MTAAVETQMEQASVPWWLVLLEGIAAVILGILLISKPSMTTLILIQFLGIYWLIKGIFSIVSIFIDSSGWGWKLLVGVLGIVAGILVIQHPLWSTAIVVKTVVIVIAIQAIIIGIIEIIQAFQGGGLGIGLLGALSMVLGIILLVHRGEASWALPLVAGIFLIIGGIVAVVASFRLKSA